VIDWKAAILVADWGLRLAMLPIILSRQRSSTAALAWMVVVFFMPWLGSILYFLFGEIRLGKRRLAHYSRHADTSVLKHATPVLQKVVRPEVVGLGKVVSRVAEHLGAMGPLGGNHVEPITDTDEFIRLLIERIDAAERHVHLLFYIIRPDETGGRVCDALVRAAARGVECRVLADGAGSRPFLGTRADLLRAKGVKVVAAFPVGILRQRFHRVDLRNHRKLAVIDAAVAFTGSQNIVNANYGHTRIGAWQDLSLLLEGPAVAHLQAVFAEDWHYQTGEDLDQARYFEPAGRPHSAGGLSIELAGDVAVQVVPSGPHTREGSVVRDLLLEALHGARDRVVITTPYFVPDDAMMAALRLAAVRGVQVDLVVPKRTDSRIADLIARSRFEALLEAGVHIHQHRVGLLHAKTMSVDDALAFVGSANFDVRSFFLNFELSLLLYGPDAAARLRAAQRQYLNESTVLAGSEWVRRPRSVRFAEDVASLFSPLM
jgi:cardiolipin synthase